ncbi:demethylmenaquinone methyltransferase [Paenibacillus montaniterrae]|uniref:Demethylmenaquinone methyltransferase n=2 Tax=Paenibacillus montaniterrae TaxID=429341 RepID=A0A919YJQ1_9BACL|nr:demethylmenaquinone methyltransferase [Paenibacillus montaniterrae]
MSSNSMQNSKSHVHDLFENIAPKYDKMNDIMSFRQHKVWRKKTMQLMNVQPGQTALDLCCGTCDWTIDLARASKTGKIIGLDFSEQMLAIGKRKVVEAGLDAQVELVQGNAMELPFADNSFDYVTIGFGLRNVPDYKQVVSEMLRVVKPGGKIVCLDMSKPQAQPFKSIYYFYFEKIVPLLGKAFAKRFAAYKWLPDSLQLFLDAKELKALFEQVGAKEVYVKNFFLGVAALHIGKK